MAIFRTNLISIALLMLLQACGDINKSWESDGGGYIKYQINGSSDFTLELEPDDVEIPNYHRHYFFLQTSFSENKKNDAFAIMVYKPSLGENSIVEEYSWFSFQGSPKGVIYNNQSTIKFDQLDDSTWTADLNLYAEDCRLGVCTDTLPRIHITGRMRYWIPPDD